MSNLIGFDDWIIPSYIRQDQIFSEIPMKDLKSDPKWQDECIKAKFLIRRLIKKKRAKLAG